MAKRKRRRMRITDVTFPGPIRENRKPSLIRGVRPAIPTREVGESPFSVFTKKDKPLGKNWPLR